MGVLLLYLGASTVTFAVYAADKAAARGNRRRISERGLHLCGLACGWPGAQVAQQTLRHKSAKQPFRRQFWITAAVNCGVLVLYMFPRTPLQLLALYLH